MTVIMLDFEKNVQKRVCQIKDKIVCFIEYSWVNDSWFEESKFCISKQDLKRISIAEIPEITGDDIKKGVDNYGKGE